LIPNLIGVFEFSPAHRNKGSSIIGESNMMTKALSAAVLGLSLQEIKQLAEDRVVY